jgi:hypothetical protein
LARGFVKQHRRGGGRVEGFYAAGHRDSNARISAALDFFGQASAFVADEQSDRLAPIHFPWREERLVTLLQLVHAGSECADAGDFELREKDGERDSGQDGEMERSTRGRAQRFRRKRIRGAADSGSGGSGASRAECGSGAQDGADVSRILDAGENYD